LQKGSGFELAAAGFSSKPIYDGEIKARKYSDQVKKVNIKLLVQNLGRYVRVTCIAQVIISTGPALLSYGFSAGSEDRNFVKLGSVRVGSCTGEVHKS
jgi:hypothetical protein